MSESSGGTVTPAGSDPSEPPVPRADVFGTVLPDQTSDDRHAGDWREEVDRDRDDELREDVPPHH